MRGLLNSFRYAAQGIAFCAGTGRNFRLMLCAAGYVVWAGLVAGLTPVEWALELLCCGLVLSLEGVNTALEQLCDRVTRQRDPLVGRAKDCAAGAALLASLGAALVWLVLTLGGGYGSRLLDWLTDPLWHGGMFGLTVPAALWWACRRAPRGPAGMTDPEYHRKEEG